MTADTSGRAAVTDHDLNVNANRRYGRQLGNQDDRPMPR